MKKKFVVKNSRDFDKIIKKGKCLKNRYLIIYYLKNDYEYNRYGISVGKKLGNAVFRNHYKRKIRSIIDNYRKTSSNSYDYVIIMRRDMTKLSYQEMESTFDKLINDTMKG